jgi:hypothetical protein
VARRKPVRFWATKYVPRKTKVEFRNKYGERVSFTATKKVPKVVKVKFWASSKPRRKRYY